MRVKMSLIAHVWNTFRRILVGREITMKTFTLDEAQSLLPVLESLLKRAVDGKQAAEEVEAGL